MEGGPPIFRQDGSCPALLEDRCPGFPYGALTRCGAPFQTLPVPHKTTTGLVRFRSPLLAESRLMSFPPATEMFQFAGFASRAYEFSAGYPFGWVAPFGDPGITDRSHLPRAFRSVPRPSSPLSAKASTRCPCLARIHSEGRGRHQAAPPSSPGRRPARRRARRPFRRAQRQPPPAPRRQPRRVDPKHPRAATPRRSLSLKTLSGPGTAAGLTPARRPVRLGHIRKLASPVSISTARDPPGNTCRRPARRQHRHKPNAVGGAPPADQR